MFELNQQLPLEIDSSLADAVNELSLDGLKIRVAEGCDALKNASEIACQLMLKVRESRRSGTLRWRHLPFEFASRDFCLELSRHTDINKVAYGVFFLASYWIVNRHPKVVIQLLQQCVECHNKWKIGIYAAGLANYAKCIRSSTADDFLSLACVSSGYESLDAIRKVQSKKFKEKEQRNRMELKARFGNTIEVFQHNRTKCIKAFRSTDPSTQYAAMVTAATYWPQDDFSDELLDVLLNTAQSSESMNAVSGAIRLIFFGTEKKSLLEPIVSRLHYVSESGYRDILFRTVTGLMGVQPMVEPICITEEDLSWLFQAVGENLRGPADWNA